MTSRFDARDKTSELAIPFSKNDARFLRLGSLQEGSILPGTRSVPGQALEFWEAQCVGTCSNSNPCKTIDFQGVKSVSFNLV